MWEVLQHSASLIDISGYLIIGAIIVLLLIGIIVIISVRARYAGLERDIRLRGDPSVGFRSSVLNRIVREVREAYARCGGEVNAQAIVEQNFQRHLKSLLIGERFVRSLTGLLIILGLVGTFYGLTLSIGKLVVLVSGDVSGVTEITESLTKGLVQALSGMSVAFSTSLFGILAAIVMTLLGVFFNLADRRTGVMLLMEAYIDNAILSAPLTDEHGAVLSERRGPSALAAGVSPELRQMVERFGQSVGQLEQAVARFDAALEGFSRNTRDFGEFNLHLKDNIQRMSLSFSDLGQSIKAHVQQLRPGGQG